MVLLGFLVIEEMLGEGGRSLNDFEWGGEMSLGDGYCEGGRNERVNEVEIMDGRVNWLILKEIV